MSYNNPGGPRRSAPLISRPPAGAPPPQAATSFGGLGGAIAGALGGMGYGAPPGGATGYGAPAASPYGQGTMPPPLHYGGGGAGGYGPQGAYGQPQQYGPPQHYGQQASWGAPPPQHYPPPQSAYPPSFYPPSHQHYQAPPPAPYASTSSAPYPPRPQQSPQTTADGYTLSSSYVPSASSAFDAPAQSGGRGSGKRGRGSAQGAPPVQQGPKIIKCCKEDCSFTGRQKEVREHEEDRHLIYQPGREPKPWSGSLKPIDGAVIEGTGLSLDTPEAVAKWIEERKKRWPSKKVVDEKEKARAERVAAGLEAPPRERGAGRGRGRGRGQASDFGGRGRGRGGRGGFVGGSHGAPPEEGDEPAAKRLKIEDGVKQDDSGSGSSSDSSDLSSSGSDDEDSDDDGPPEEEASSRRRGSLDGLKGEDEDEEDEGPEAQGVKKEEGGEEKAEPEKRFQVVCRHWRKGQCQLGDEKCPYLHHIPANAPPPPPPKRKRPAPPPPAHNPFARPASFSSDPFAQLAERDHRHLVSDVLQVIEWLGANDWLRGVEIRPGQVEEESGIEVLAETETQEVKIEEGQQDAKPVIEEMKPAEANGAPASMPSAVIPPPHPSSLPTKPLTAPLVPSPLPLTAAPVSTLPIRPLPAATAAAPAPSALSFLADYGSDTDDEADEQAVAAALVGA
ncbi:hypothetical protein JCM10213_006960 [Rhodosporidiobolus nylandii]